MTPLTWTEINGVLRAERDGAMYRVRYSSLRKAWESRIIFGGANSISRWYKEEYAKEVCQSHANAITKAGEEKSAALERTEEAWKKAEARLMELGDYYTALDEPQTVLEIRISTLEAKLKRMEAALQKLDADYIERGLSDMSYPRIVIRNAFEVIGEKAALDQPETEGKPSLAQK